MAKDINSEVTIALLQQKVETLEGVVESLQKDRDSALRWGIATLGSAVLGLGMWVFSLFEHALKVK